MANFFEKVAFIAVCSTFSRKLGDGHRASNNVSKSQKTRPEIDRAIFSPRSHRGVEGAKGGSRGRKNHLPRDNTHNHRGISSPTFRGGAIRFSAAWLFLFTGNAELPFRLRSMVSPCPLCETFFCLFKGMKTYRTQVRHVLKSRR